MLTHLATVHAAAQTNDDQYSWLWFFGFIPVALIFILWVAALVSIIKSSFRVAEKVLFIFGTFAFPILGPLIWFIFINRKQG